MRPLLPSLKVMCTLAIYFQATRNYPVVIAANRDEFLARPADNPTTLAHHPHVVGGKDLNAGGTWLGINEYGVVAGLLNRRALEGANPDVRSRGLLCLDALRHRSAADAARFTRAQRGSDYNPFNLLIASRDEAWVAHNRDGAIDMVTLTPGLHLLTNLDLDDFECPKISRSYSRFARLGEHAEFRRDPVAMQDELGAILADHETQLDSRGDRPNGLCLHVDGYGTRSSSLIFLGADPGHVEHWFAPGPPCKTAYAPAMVPERAQPESSA
jgi:uncharacterized protein with NRDE domain